MPTQISVQDRLMAVRLQLEETIIRASIAESQRDQAVAEIQRLNKRPLLVRLGLRKEDPPAAQAAPRPQRPSPLKTGESARP